MEHEKEPLRLEDGIVPPEERIIGLWFAVFINDRLIHQDRLLVLTDKAYYRIKQGALFFSHYKRYNLLEINNVMIGKIKLTAANCNQAGDANSASTREESMFKRIFTGGVATEKEVTEYAVRISINNISKTYIKIRECEQNKPNKDVLCDFALKMVNALFMCKVLPQPPNSRTSITDGILKYSREFSPNPATHKHELDHSLELVEDQEEGGIEVVGCSQIVSKDALLQILMRTPPTLWYSEWTLKYDINVDGGSLSNFYYKMQKNHCSSSVIILKDEHHHVFGAYCTELWQPNQLVYGTGESFLFKVPFSEGLLASIEMQFYFWQKETRNHCFQMSSPHFIATGSGGYGFGLWLDDELLTGHSDRCETYANEPLASEPVFRIIGMEVWAPHNK